MIVFGSVKIEKMKLFHAKGAKEKRVKDANYEKLIVH